MHFIQLFPKSLGKNKSFSENINQINQSVSRHNTDLYVVLMLHLMRTA